MAVSPYVTIKSRKESARTDVRSEVDAPSESSDGESSMESSSANVRSAIDAPSVSSDGESSKESSKANVRADVDAPSSKESSCDGASGANVLPGNESSADETSSFGASSHAKSPLFDAALDVADFNELISDTLQMPGMARDEVCDT